MRGERVVTHTCVSLDRECYSAMCKWRCARVARRYICIQWSETVYGLVRDVIDGDSNEKLVSIH